MGNDVTTVKGETLPMLTRVQQDTIVFKAIGTELFDELNEKAEVTSVDAERVTKANRKLNNINSVDHALDQEARLERIRKMHIIWEQPNRAHLSMKRGTNVLKESDEATYYLSKVVYTDFSERKLKKPPFYKPGAFLYEKEFGLPFPDESSVGISNQASKATSPNTGINKPAKLTVVSGRFKLVDPKTGEVL